MNVSRHSHQAGAVLTLGITLLLFLFSCRAFQGLMPFSPSAKLVEKWSRISEWIPDGTGYIAVADVHKLASTDFFKKVFADDGGRMMPVFKGFDVGTDAGIAVFVNGLIYIGGRFEPMRAVEKIKAALEEEKTALAEEGYGGKIIYTEKDSGSSFSFLEKYLICQGKRDDIKRLIDLHKSKKIRPPKIESGHLVWGRLGDGMRIYSNVAELEFNADISSAMNLRAEARLPSEKDAKLLADEIEGIKTIRTIQSIDEPWLAEIIDGISVKQAGNSVRLAVIIDSSSMKKILKRGIK